jgi:hypothetical protein
VRNTARLSVALLACVLAAIAAFAASASAQSQWRLEQPAPPEPSMGVKSLGAPIGLGHIGAISFASPDRGVLITAGNPKTIPASVWFYNGQDWHELSEECGGSDGRVAWASDTQNPRDEEFWTISNGRPGQAEVDFKTPPIEDDTLCRFLNGKIVESFASPAFEAGSYVPMHAAACLSPDDCWFGGESLPPENPEIGAFQLHWNGSSISEEPYRGEAHAVEELTPFEGRLYESVQLLKTDPVVKDVGLPPALHVLESEEALGGFAPEGRLSGEELYSPEKRPWSLNYLRLSAGAQGLWAASGLRPESEEEGVQPTVLRYTPESGGEWRQLLGPRTSPTGEEAFPGSPPCGEHEHSKPCGETIESIAAEGSGSEEGAWLALQTNPEARQSFRGTPASSSYATVARITAGGSLAQTETLPASSEEGIGGKGAASKVVCPAAGDCWLATTTGWLFHYAPAGEQTLPEAESSFSQAFITERPPDKGLPQTQPDSLPVDDSGLLGEIPTALPVGRPKPRPSSRVPVALVSDVHTRLHGTTLEMRFHLAVKARVRLIAKRKHHIVAETAKRTFKAGTRLLTLKLERTRWPTELHLSEQALAPLPTVSANAGSSETLVTSSLAFPAHSLSDPLQLP